MHNLPMTILMDSRSSHNILQPYLAAICTSPSLSSLYSLLWWTIGKESLMKVSVLKLIFIYLAPYFILPFLIEGDDVVLKIE